MLAAALLVAGSGVHAQNWTSWNHDNDRGEAYDSHRNDWHDKDRREDQRGNVRNDDHQDRGGGVTETQKNACRPDVFRLCSRYIPSRNKITACLHLNIDKLNSDCRAVMEGRLR